MQQIDEAQLDSYIEQWMYRRLSRRLFPFFRGIVQKVELPPGVSSGPPFLVQVLRTGESTVDTNDYTSALSSYAPVVGDDIDLMWRDNDTAYVFAPISGPGVTAAGLPGWKHWSRYVVGPGGAGDTSSNPGGDIPLPPGYNHAWIIVTNAVDNGGGTNGTFGGMQVAVNNGPLDTASDYVWTDIGVFTTTGGVNNSALSGSGNGQDIGWAPFVLSGGGIGSTWPSSADIYLPGYSNPSVHATAHWEIFQLNSGTAVRRMGGGYNTGSAGAITLVHFFARANHMIAGVTFDLYVSK